MSALVETVAERLYAVAVNHHHSHGSCRPVPWARRERIVKDCYRRMARHAILMMEWTRHEESNRVSGGSYALTLPPMNWRPG